MLDNILKVVVIGQLFTCHNAVISSEKCHARLSCHNPLHHLAVGFAGVVDEASNGSACGINDHVLVEGHKVVALLCMSAKSEFFHIS